MNKLIINGDTWGEFSGSTKKKDGTIEIRGYRSYDRLHTVRVMDHPEGLNSNQQIVLEWLKSDDHPNYSNILNLFSDLLDYQVPIEVADAFTQMMTDKKQQFQVLEPFAAWGQSEVQDDTEV